MANYISKRGANVAPSYASTGDLPDSTEVGDLVFVGGQLGIAVSASSYQTCDKTDIVFVADWTATTQQAKVQASDAQTSDYFGQRVGISGDTMVVGAYAEDAGGSSAGAAYVFTRSGTSWSQQAKLASSDIQTGDFFGYSVAIDGDTIVVGAFGEDAGGSSAGAAYVFTRSGTTWSQQAKLVASDAAANDKFGESVSIDGDTIVVSAAYEGAATGVYTNSNAGAAYVFTRSGTTWSQQAKIQASDAAADNLFGISTAINGDTILVGATFPYSVGGGVYVFTRSGTSWSQQAKLASSDIQAGDDFGNSVAIDGDTMIAGARYEDTEGSNAGAVYVFTRSGTSWSQQAKLASSDIQAGDLFGQSVSIEGDTLVVGAKGEDPAGGSAAGAAYVLTRSGTSWTQAKKFVASDGQASDQFGASISISSNTVAVGSYGVTGNTGAAYAFVAG